MKGSVVWLSALTMAAMFSSSLQAMTCSQFNSLGHDASSEQQVAASPATKRQISEFKKIIAEHAGEIAGFGWFSDRKKELDVVMERKMMTRYLRDSLAITRVECFNRPDEPMSEVAEEQFNYMLDVLAEKL